MMVGYKITEYIATLGERGEWHLELNRVKWNGNSEKLDIRAWSSDHSRCGKGITLSEHEAKMLKTALEEI